MNTIEAIRRNDTLSKAIVDLLRNKKTTIDKNLEIAKVRLIYDDTTRNVALQLKGASDVLNELIKDVEGK